MGQQGFKPVGMAMDVADNVVVHSQRLPLPAFIEQKRSWPFSRWLLDQDPSEKQRAGPACRRHPDQRADRGRQGLCPGDGRARPPTPRASGRHGLRCRLHQGRPGSLRHRRRHPGPENRKGQPRIEGHVSVLRNLVERSFSELKHSRRLATHQEKTANSHLGFVPSPQSAFGSGNFATRSRHK